MSTLDTVIIAVILLFGALGIYWGLIRQVLALAGLVAGVVLASRYGMAVAEAFSALSVSDTLAQALGFIFVLIGVSAAASLLATLLRRFVGLLFLGWLDHLAGGVLGLLQGLLACTVVIIVAATFPSDLWMQPLLESQFAPIITRLPGALILMLLPDQFRFAAQQMLGGS